MADAHIEKWTGWVELGGPLYSNVMTMNLHRATWRQVQEILVANGTLPDSYWWEFMTDTYATTQTTAVRRQLDRRADVASLWRLLDEVRRFRQSLSREFWFGLWADADPHLRDVLAQRNWDEFAGGGDYIDAELVAADQEALEAALGEVKKYVDEHVAHTKWTANPVDPEEASAEVTLTLEHVHQAVDH